MSMYRQNPFRALLATGYGDDDQGLHSAAYVVLSLAAEVYDHDPNHPAINPGGDPSPYLLAEALRRLGKYKDTHFVRQLGQDAPVH